MRCFEDLRLVAALSAVTLSGQVASEPGTGGKPLNVYTIEKEIVEGATIAREIERQGRLVRDSLVMDYVNDIAQRIAKVSDTKVPVSVKVLEGSVPVASSLLGGLLFVNSALVLTAESETELAAAMAHEVGHIAARHHTRQLTRQQMINLATIPQIFMGGWTGGKIRAAFLDYRSHCSGSPTLFSYHSRAFEVEADLLTTQYLNKAGYDPMAFVDFFTRIQAGGQSDLRMPSKTCYTHLPGDDRIKFARKHIQETFRPPPSGHRPSSPRLNEVKARLAAMARKPPAERK